MCLIMLRFVCFLFWLLEEIVLKLLEGIYYIFWVVKLVEGGNMMKKLVSWGC